MDDKLRTMANLKMGYERKFKKKKKKAIWKSHMQYFSLDRENITKYGKAGRPRSRQTGREGGRGEGRRLWSPVWQPEQLSKRKQRAREEQTVTFPDAD